MQVFRDDEKLARVRAAMRQAGLAALVSHNPENVVYLSGVWLGRSLSYVILPVDGEPVLVLSTGETRPRTWISDIRSFSSETYHRKGNTIEAGAEKVRETLSDMEVDRGAIGIERNMDRLLSTPMRYEMNIIDESVLRQKLAACDLKDASNLLVQVRSLKTEQEVKLLRKANRVALIGLEAFQGGLKAGLSEIELSATIEYEIATQALTRYRASQVVACAFVASGPLAAEGYKYVIGNTRRKLRQGDLVMLELDVAVDGYSSDLTRTYVVGKPNGKQRKLFEAVLDSETSAISAIKPYVRASDIAKIASEVLERYGLSQYLVHRLGHGIGVGVHEPIPALHVESTDVLHPGMVHSVEPGIYGPKVGGIRIEDNILDTKKGSECLSNFQRIPD
jgi:Xaa-Pro dipeptidase